MKKCFYNSASLEMFSCTYIQLNISRLAPLLFIGTLLSLLSCHRLEEKKIKIGNHIFTVELPVTMAEKAKGLGYRDSMPQDHCMLFIYKPKRMHSFWMKGMRFPLDFVWIDGNRVVDITENVPVAKGVILPRYRPRVPVDKILELNAGVVKKSGISVGDVVTLLD